MLTLIWELVWLPGSEGHCAPGRGSTPQHSTSSHVWVDTYPHRMTKDFSSMGASRG